MLLSRDGLINIESFPNPESRLSDESLAQLGSAADEELDHLLNVIESVEVDAHDELEKMVWTPAESDFEAMPLPDGLFSFDSSPGALADNVDRLLRDVELRWRLDLATTLSGAIWDIQDARRRPLITRVVGWFTRKKS